jgi:hypothetical protein
MTTFVNVFTDAEGAVRLWVNSRMDLVGPGGPLPKGAHLKRLRSPYQGAYVLLERIGGGEALTPERPFDRARVSAQIIGLSKESAALGAIAFANAVAELRGAGTSMGSNVCLFASDITGPISLTELDNEPRYLVDADYYLQ